MIQAARQSEENFAREQEQARVRDEQLRSVRQTDRSGLNFFAQANSTQLEMIIQEPTTKECISKQTPRVTFTPQHQTTTTPTNPQKTIP